jgi:hypothetical protein
MEPQSSKAKSYEARVCEVISGGDNSNNNHIANVPRLREGFGNNNSECVVVNYSLRGGCALVRDANSDPNKPESYWWKREWVLDDGEKYDLKSLCIAPEHQIFECRHQGAFIGALWPTEVLCTTPDGKWAWVRPPTKQPMPKDNEPYYVVPSAKLFPTSGSSLCTEYLAKDRVQVVVVDYTHSDYAYGWHDATILKRSDDDEDGYRYDVEFDYEIQMEHGIKMEEGHVSFSLIRHMVDPEGA